MSLINEEKNDNRIIRYYKLDDIITDIDAVRWFSQVRTLEGLVTSYIYFRNLSCEYEEGSYSIEFNADISLRDLESNIKKQSIDNIRIIGYYKGELVVIGAELNTHNLFILKETESPADIDDLEVQLKLVNL